MLDADFALFNVDQLVTAAPGCHPAARGDLGIIESGAVAARGEKIVWVGPMSELHDAVQIVPGATVLDAHGRTVLPGFVDPHTHLVFAGERMGDFYARIHGESYSQQLEAGGIMQTIKATREADEDALLAGAYQRAETFLLYGTTTVEAKTGYGLTLDAELKSLRVLNRLQKIQPLKVVPAFLGAHVVPSERSDDADAYVRELIDEWLPAARPDSVVCDVWCDEGAFTADQCRAILRRAGELGYALTAHANELGPGEGVRVAAEAGCLSVDHAVYLDDGDIDALHQSGTVAVLLPGTTFFLGSDTYAPARRLLEANVPVALGTDFNPGTSYTQNMQFVLSLGVLKLKMTPEEAIQGATTRAARAIGMEHLVGSLQPGRFCDFAVYRVDEFRQIPYQYAMNLVETVVAAGEIVVREGSIVSAPGRVRDS